MNGKRLGDYQLIDTYLRMKEAVIASGFAYEIDWQEALQVEQVTEARFLREAAWVILSAGMAESVIRKTFPTVSKAFFHWHSARLISQHAQYCRSQSLKAFANLKKIDSIINLAKTVQTSGFDTVKNRMMSDGVAFVQSLPFMGPATSFHLMKNLGFDVVKPDRHLTRIARAAGYGCAEELCAVIATAIGERVSVVDVVLWRYATLDLNYKALFSRRKEFHW